MKLVRLIVRAEQDIVCPWVKKLHPDVAGDGGLVLFNTQLGRPLLEDNWLVVASDDQVFIPPSSHRALIKRVDDAHVRHLLEPQQTALVELHAITPIWPNADHRPDDKCNE